jgi:alpha-galactosidase/6-phospho-beta-glucosidase family protein
MPRTKVDIETAKVVAELLLTHPEVQRSSELQALVNEILEALAD